MKGRFAAYGLSIALGFAGSAFAQPAPPPATRPAGKMAATRPAPPPKPPAPPPAYSGLNPKTMPASAGTPDNTPPAGFTAAFNGTDLAGWKGLLDPKKKLDNPIVRGKLPPEELKAAQAEADENMRANWAVEDGALVFSGKGRSLCTAKDYTDFEMWVDWKIKKGGDSGVYLRGSPQVQIWDTALTRVGAQVGSGGLYNNEKNPAIPLKVADHPIEQWNTFFIRMVGDKVTVYLNGELVTDHVTLENYWARGMKMPNEPIFPSGQIELQNHGNTLWFKNIYIKELPAGGEK